MTLQVAVSGGLDDLKPRDLWFFEEAAKLGELTVLLWPGARLQNHAGWRLQNQTHSPSQGLSTNWTDVPNTMTTNQITPPCR